MRDVLEHIHNQARFISFVRNLLAAEGVLFIAFPMEQPFGGTEVCDSASVENAWITFCHAACYRRLLGAFGESQAKIEGLLR
jgi:hypothetical protein